MSMQGIQGAPNAAPSSLTRFCNYVYDNRITLLCIAALSYIAVCYGTETALTALAVVTLIPTLVLLVIGFVVWKILQSLVRALFGRDAQGPGQSYFFGNSWGRNWSLPSFSNPFRRFSRPTSPNYGSGYSGRGHGRYEAKGSRSNGYESKGAARASSPTPPSSAPSFLSSAASAVRSAAGSSAYSVAAAAAPSAPSAPSYSAVNSWVNHARSAPSAAGVSRMSAGSGG